MERVDVGRSALIPAWVDQPVPCPLTYAVSTHASQRTSAMGGEQTAELRTPLSRLKRHGDSHFRARADIFLRGPEFWTSSTSCRTIRRRPEPGWRTSTKVQRPITVFGI